MIRRGKQSVRAKRNRTRKSVGKQMNKVRRSLSKTKKKNRGRKSKSKTKKLTAKSKKTIQQWKKILKEKGINYEPKKSKSKRKSKMKGGARLLLVLDNKGEIKLLLDSAVKADGEDKIAEALQLYGEATYKFHELVDGETDGDKKRQMNEFMKPYYDRMIELSSVDRSLEAGGGAALDRSLDRSLEADQPLEAGGVAHPEIDRSQVLGRIVEVEMTPGSWRKGKIIAFNKKFGTGASEHVILFDVPREKQNIKLKKGKNDTDQDKKNWRVIEGELTKLPLPTFEAPRWVYKEEENTCMLCEKPFGPTRWRYNCLSCGILVCNNCSGENKGIYEYFDPTKSTSERMPPHPKPVSASITMGIVGQAAPPPVRVCTRESPGRTPCAAVEETTTHPGNRAYVKDRVAQSTLGDRNNVWLSEYIAHINSVDEGVDNPDVLELINMAKDIVKLEKKWDRINKQTAAKEYDALQKRLDTLKGDPTGNLPSAEELEQRLLALKFPSVPTHGGVGGGGASGGASGL